RGLVCCCRALSVDVAASFVCDGSVVECHLPSLVCFDARATTEIYTLSLHDALPIFFPVLGFEKGADGRWHRALAGRVKTIMRPRSEEHTSELQSRENLVCRLLLEKKNAAGCIYDGRLDKFQLKAHRRNERPQLMNEH